MKLIRAILILAFAGSILAGCGNDEPSRPKPISTGPSISNIWPNDDGRAWTYTLLYRTWGSWAPSRLYLSKYQVPPLPTMGEVAAILRSQPIGERPDSVQGIYRLQFRGLITTPPGVTAQNLMEDFYAPQMNPGGTAQVGPEKAFLARLMVARPDLKNRIAAYLNSGHGLELPGLGSSSTGLPGNTLDSAVGTLFDLVVYPTLLHGGAWQKTNKWIGTYGDIDTLLAWKFLESPLITGHKFTHQLAPSVADDIFEHCLILPSVSFQTKAGLFLGAIECLYLIDYGILAATDAEGHSIGYSRFFDYGTVVYVPNVGPVYSYERMLVEPGDTLTAGAGDLTLSLVGTGTTGY